jgi:hypothetical protein
MTPDRRRAVRRTPGADDPIAHARLRTGGHLVVRDISHHGAFVGGIDRLLPGRAIDVHIITGVGRVLVRARVVRCEVHAVSASSVHYQAALAFVNPIDAAESGNSVPLAATPEPAARASTTPDPPPAVAVDAE